MQDDTAKAELSHMRHIAASESLEQFGMANLFPPSIPSQQSPLKAATNLIKAAARLSPRQDAHVPAAAVPHGLAQHEQAQHGLAQHGQAEHGLAQREQAHQSAQDMLSSRWANAPWTDALSSYLPQPDAQYTANKPVADSNRTSLHRGRGNPHASKPADDAINRPAVAPCVPNALFRKAHQINKAVPCQVSTRAASWLGESAVAQLSELGRNEHDKASLGSAAQQQPAAGSALDSAPLLPDSRATSGPASAALLPGGAAAVGEPLLPDGKAAGGEVTIPLLPTGWAAGGGFATPLLSTGKAAAAGPETVTVPPLPAAKGVTGDVHGVPTPLLPTGQAAAKPSTLLLLQTSSPQLQLQEEEG